MNWHEEYDVVVVGSGAGGLVAAITAAYQGLNTVIVEKGSEWGGSSALSGGGLWIPNNHVSKKAGLQDSEEEALTYMQEVIEDTGPASTYERKVAYVKNGHRMVKFLEDLGMKWVPGSLYPDYYPEKPGGKIGRSIEGEIFDARLLGDYEKTLRKGEIEAPLPLYSGKVASLPKAFTNAKDFNTVVGMFINGFKHKVKGHHAISIGSGLVGRLLKIALNHNVAIKLSTPLTDLVIENNKIIGVEVENEGKPFFLKSKAVVLAGGGFERNPYLRKKYHNVGTDWTAASPDNTGDMLLIAQKHNIDTALLDDAWWGPTTLDASGSRKFLVYERSMPHCIIVDQTGERYFNESQSYTDAGHAILERQEKNGKAIHSWLIMESRNRNKYLFGDMLPRRTPKEAIQSGFLIKAESIRELAEKCQIDYEGLKATITRFNKFVEKGKDEDFGRGNSAYDNYYGDPTYKNPNLGAIEKAPFYACKIFPGDLGTKGGIVANEYGQALRNNIPIEGLYATGNCSASVMGRVYPGPGSTLGPTTVFGYISANHIKENMLRLVDSSVRIV
ncbi:FAD-dependent oxidoreductase [Bacillus sp. EB106-08-02-XG196]|jgi:succinate dehydrogenase/fumarate reductase flavoprotein subunit|uniref:FAD-dependent oxidoreductase n=1 Tax=Bacillus sp. EB106-08-02-XG196 TaxID=2737049 RepID=UPI0015C4C01E|nr:FAD-dependent oxidoreductase [Bacillus sp. EB106-08-02-XG196]NWQ40293.1 FAD-dependent oxidoreductase [Bacillus sp. EB106-08-02-XG196]